MPRGDHTGPAGLGSMTGRGAGYCAGYGKPGHASDAPGLGIGGFGRCRGRGVGFFGRGSRGAAYNAGRPWRMHFGGYGTSYAAPQPTYDPAVEKQALNDQARALQSELDAIKKRLDEMEAETVEA